MSVNSNAYIPTFFGAEDVKDIIKSMGYAEVKVEPAMSGFCNITFMSLPSGEKNRLCFFYNTSDFALPCNHVMGGMNCPVLEEIVRRTGGVYVPNDCTDVATVSDGLFNRNSAIFTLKWGICNGIVEGSNQEDSAKASEAFEAHINRDRNV